MFPDITKYPWGDSRLKLPSVKDHSWVRARTDPGNDPGFYCNYSGSPLEAFKQRVLQCDFKGNTVAGGPKE